MTTTEHVTDVLVIGSGGSGLTAAITARLNGCSVVLTEKQSDVGGTTAVSGGQLWIPLSRHAAAQGIKDSADAVRDYIRHSAGNDFDAERVDAFLTNAPKMVAFLEDNTELRYGLPRSTPDYAVGAPGWLAHGRSLVPMRYDASRLGRFARMLAPRRRWSMVMGMQVSAEERSQFINALRSTSALFYVTKRLLRHVRDYLFYGRTTTVFDGNALIGPLLKAALDRGVEIWTSSPAQRLIVEDGAVRGAVIERNGQTINVRTRRGVILAAGGFPHDEDRRRRIFAHVANGSEHLTPATPGATGDGARMAEAVGAKIISIQSGANAAWVPVVHNRQEPGAPGNIPVFSGRGSPGVIAVAEDGRRFANEALPYHYFVQRWLAASAAAGRKQIACFFIADQRAIQRYGLGGVVRPFPYRPATHLRSGVLVKADTIGELADKIGVDRVNLEETVRRMNQYARDGKDPEFNRGEGPYDPTQGDSKNKPNSCLGPIDQAPFYAVRAVPGHIATFAGLKADGRARVLNADNRPIPGLYVAGNDMSTAFGGAYVGRGGTLGPGLTYGYIAGREISGAASA